jgi:hypothetical protein
MSSREGISQEERDKLNYAPVLEYQLPKIQATQYVGPLEALNDPSLLVRPVMTDTWTKVADIVDRLSDIEDKLSIKLENDRVKVPVAIRDEIRLAASKYGKVVDTSIYFSLYKEALNSSDSYEKNLIVDTYENYHVDVNGNINAELYTDIAEMITDWKSYIEFIKKGLFAQIVPVGDLPSTVSSTDSNLKKIDAAEKQLIEQYKAAQKAYAEALKDVRAKYFKNPQSQEFYDSQYQNSIKEKQFKKVERVILGKSEAYSLIDSKIVDADIISLLIGNSIDYMPYKGGTMDILHNLLRQYPSRQSMENGLRKIQALIKLSVDGKTESVTNSKNGLRNISSQPNKDKMNQALVNGIHLRNNVFGEVHETMEYFDGIPDDGSIFNVFAEHIVDGITYADKLYENQAADFYKIHTLDAELRMQKVRNVIDKHSAREIYKLAEKLINYAVEKNTWPEQKNLSQWLSDFMKAGNLS